MNVLLIPDKFKGSISAKGVIEALTMGIRRAVPNASIDTVLASDGGDGFLDAVSNYVAVETVVGDTIDPLGRKIKAPYLLNQETDTAYVELAKASGLELLKETERNPMFTSTLGTGIQILDAIHKGAKKIFIGLGGSATNDGGIGIANALGNTFLDASGNELRPIAANLSKIDRIDNSKARRLLKDISIFAVNDVSNPLFGENGAAYIYAEQKGADRNEIEVLDIGLQHLDHLVQQQLNKKNAAISGAGAAGGTAYGLKTFGNAEFISGIDFILQLAGTQKLIEQQSMDYIITGEGKIDSQTLQGKLINGVLNLGKEHGIPLIAVCGTLDMDKDDLKRQGLPYIIEVRDASKPLAYNMENAAKLVENAIHNFFKNQ